MRCAMPLIILILRRFTLFIADFIFLFAYFLRLITPPISPLAADAAITPAFTPFTLPPPIMPLPSFADFASLLPRFLPLERCRCH